MRKKIIIAGGSGFLGQSLSEYFLQRGAEVIVLTRKKNNKESPVSYSQWDGETIGEWVTQLEGATALINLSGRSVNCRYTEKNKTDIINSRVKPTQILGEAIRQLSVPPKVWINAGSVAIFGDGGDTIKTEQSSPGQGFSSDVCKHWENAFNNENVPFTRKLIIRMGLVFQKNRGLLQPFMRLVQSGLGGTIGSGKQYISWIHEEDFLQLFQLGVDRNDFTGTVHACSPLPVRNREFLKSLRSVCNVPFGIPHPAPLLKLVAPFAGTEAGLLLTGRRVVSSILKEKEIGFKYPDINDALASLVKS